MTGLEMKIRVHPHPLAAAPGPNIRLKNTGLQIPRVAKARGLTEEPVRKPVQQNIHNRDLGLFGEPRVNVVTLNFALDPLPQK